MPRVRRGSAPLAFSPMARDMGSMLRCMPHLFYLL
jgi:hypothetical protein